MTLPQGIGPHEGRELELMLKGEKHCAIFHDAVPATGTIAEEIIPERAFAPFVANGTIFRMVQDFPDATSGQTVRVVCFTMPSHEWRAHFLIWQKARLFNGNKTDDADDMLEGRILGYSNTEIAAYIAHKNRNKK